MHPKITLALLLPLAGLLSPAIAQKNIPAGGSPRVPLVQVAPVTYSTETIPVRAAGLLSRKAEAELSFKLGGIIEAVLVRPGDKVEKGQVLARLQLEEIDALVAQARSALEKARRDQARLETLAANRVATLENLQDARTAVAVAEAGVRIAEFNARHAVIVAPLDGQILRRLREPHELVTPGLSVLGFASDSEGWLVRVGLADREVAHVQVGDVVEVWGSDAEDRKVRGRIARISEAADPVTRTTPVEIALETPPAHARSGMVVATRITPATVAARPVVPATALVGGSGVAAAVYVLDEGTAKARRLQVETEAILGEYVFLHTALPASGRVVVTGAEYLRDGVTVSVSP